MPMYGSDPRNVRRFPEATTGGNMAPPPRNLDVTTGGNMTGPPPAMTTGGNMYRGPRVGPEAMPGGNMYRGPGTTPTATTGGNMYRGQPTDVRSTPWSMRRKLAEQRARLRYMRGGPETGRPTDQPETTRPNETFTAPFTRTPAFPTDETMRRFPERLGPGREFLTNR